MYRLVAEAHRAVDAAQFEREALELIGSWLRADAVVLEPPDRKVAGGVEVHGRRMRGNLEFRGVSFGVLSLTRRAPHPAFDSGDGDSLRSLSSLAGALGAALRF